MTALIRPTLLLCTVVLAACAQLPPASAPEHHTEAVTHPSTAAVSPEAIPTPPADPPPDQTTTLPTQVIEMAPELPKLAPVAPVVAPADLWERIARGFAIPDMDDEHVQYWEDWYASRPEYWQRMADRASKYLFYIVEEVERRNLPLELALLPFIESAFNPQAVSRAKAAGMWQFMPATGKHFDLKQNAFRDDRRDILASTRAALDYLERLHGMFGDWHLALAAYNWGEGNVQRAIQRNQAAGLGTGYLDLRMPDETRNYVPKLQAVKNLIRAPHQRGVTLPVIGNHPFFDTVRIDRDIDVALIARLADISEADFRALNPSHNKPVILAAGTPEILLPWDNAELFTERLRQHTGPTASWTAWRVPRNMSVAQAARLVDWNERELRELNRIPPRMRLKAGATILVPRKGKLNRDVPEHLADNAHLLLAPERPATATVRIKVRAGDTLTKIARRHGVSIAKLAAWNKLRPNSKLRIGQTLLLRQPAARRSAASGVRRASAPRQAQGKATTKAKAKANTAQTRKGAGHAS